MKTVYKLWAFLLIGLLFSPNIYADKVYGSGSTTTTQTYKERGFVDRIQNPQFILNARLGMVSNVDVVVVHGENPDVSSDSTPDVWDGNVTYIYSGDASEDILSIASSSASDTGVITIEGLDLTGDVVTRTPTLNGTTRVAITGLWRVLDVKNDTSTDTIGNVFVYTGTSTVPSLGGATVRGVILAGNGKSHMAFYTIPDDKVGVLVKNGSAIISQGGTGTLNTRLKIRKFGKAFRRFSSTVLTSPNNASSVDSRIVPLIIPGKSDIKYSIIDDSVDNLGISGDFEILIFDETFIETDTLTNIGQPGF